MKQPKEKYAHYGLYMVVMSMLVLAIVVLANGIAHRLPVSWTQFDTSASRLYSLSPQTEEIAAGLTEDVTLYLVAPTGEEDETLLRLLQKYEALSEHITTSTVDPVLSPTFVQTYTSAKVSDNSILVVGAERSRVIRNSDLYPSNYDYDTGRTSTEFDGEGQITSAIHYVTSDAVSKIYLVTGHGEDALSESFTAALEKEGVAQESLNLTTVSQIPEDAGCLFFNVPVSDLSEGEAAVLTSYLEQGGRMVLISGITSAQMPNLDRVLSAYGVAAAQGMIVESDSNGAIPSYPNFLLPQIRSHAITDPFLQENGLLLLPNAHAIVHLDEVRSTVSIEDLLVTSEASYLKTDTATLSYQEGDLTGPLSVGVAITEDTAQGETKLVWFSSSTLLAEDFDEMVGGNNTDLVLNAIGWMTEQDNGISIRPKATSSTSLRLTGAQAGWAVLFVLVIPLIVLAVGIIFFVEKHKAAVTKRQIRTMIASAVAVVLLLAVYCIQGLSTLKTDEAEGVCVYSMDPDSITAIRFSGAGGPVSLVRTADGWCWEEDAAFPLNQNFVDTMLEKTATLQVLRQVAEGKDAYAAYGLDNPSNVITITSQEQGRILYLGDTNGTTGDCYLSVEGSDVVYTVDSTFPTLFSSSINDMAVRETLPGITTEDITAFSVTRGAEEISFQSTQEEAGDQQRWTVNQNGAVYEADTGLVTELFSKIIQLRYTHMEVYQPKDEQLAECGLKPAEAVLEVSYALEDGTPQTYVLQIGALSQDGESRYVYTPDGQGIYTVQADSLEELLQLKAESFLSMDVFPVRPEELAQLHITAPNGTVTFQADHSGDAVRYTCNDAEITEAEFNSFYFVLYAMEAEKRVGDLSDQLTQAPVMTMEYQRVAGDSHLTELIPYDQNYYAVRTDGTAVLLVNRTTVNTLLSTLDPYLAK